MLFEYSVSSERGKFTALRNLISPFNFSYKSKSLKTLCLCVCGREIIENYYISLVSLYIKGIEKKGTGAFKCGTDFQLFVIKKNERSKNSLSAE